MLKVLADFRLLYSPRRWGESHSPYLWERIAFALSFGTNRNPPRRRGESHSPYLLGRIAILPVVGANRIRPV